MTENIGDIYTLINPYADIHHVYTGGAARCKNRYKTPMKKAKRRKKAKAKKRMKKQSRRHNR